MEDILTDVLINTDRDFNYYRTTSLTYHSQHGPGIICLACETSKYLLAQYAKKLKKFPLKWLDQNPETADNETEESIKHFSMDPSLQGTSVSSETVSIPMGLPEYEQSSVTDKVEILPTEFHDNNPLPVQIRETEEDSQSDCSIVIIEDILAAQEVPVIDLTNSDSNDSVFTPEATQPSTSTENVRLTGPQPHVWTTEQLNMVGPDGHTFQELLKIPTAQLTQEQLDFLLPPFKCKWAEDSDRVWMACFGERFPYHSPLFN